MKSEYLEIELNTEVLTELEQYCTSLYVNKGFNSTVEELVVKILSRFVENELDERDSNYFPIITGKLVEPESAIAE